MDIDDDDDFYSPEEPQAPAAPAQPAAATAAQAAPKNDVKEELEEGEEEDEGGEMDEDEDSVRAIPAICISITSHHSIANNAPPRMSTSSPSERTIPSQPLHRKSLLQQPPISLFPPMGDPLPLTSPAVQTIQIL